MCSAFVFLVPLELRCRSNVILFLKNIRNRWRVEQLLRECVGPSELWQWQYYENNRLIAPARDFMSFNGAHYTIVNRVDRYMYDIFGFLQVISGIHNRNIIICAIWGNVKNLRKNWNTNRSRELHTKLKKQLNIGGSCNSNLGFDTPWDPSMYLGHPLCIFSIHSIRDCDVLFFVTCAQIAKAHRERLTRPCRRGAASLQKNKKMFTRNSPLIRIFTKNIIQLPRWGRRRWGRHRWGPFRSRWALWGFPIFP